MLDEAIGWAMGAWWLGATVLYVGTCFVPVAKRRVAAASRGPGVSVAVPLKGMEAELDDNLEALFHLEYRDFELIFLVADADDPALSCVRAAIERHPERAAQLIVGDAKITRNPKVNNLIRAETAARYPLLLMCDSNIAIARDTLGRLVAMLDDDVGLVSTVPIAVRPANFVGELECAMFNGHGARWLYAARFLGHPVAVGKIMLVRKRDLARVGGIPAMAGGLCEDSVLGAAIGALGLRVLPAEAPALHPVGNRRLRDFWQRHLRWHCCRRCHDRVAFLAEPVLGAVGATVAGAIFWRQIAHGSMLPAAAAFVAAWLALEAMLHLRHGWPFSWRSPAAWLARELLMPVLWVRAATVQSLTWRGSRLDVQNPSLVRRDAPGTAPP